MGNALGYTAAAGVGLVLLGQALQNAENERANSREATIDFFHYTDAEGINAIKRSGYIKESSEDNSYAHYGRGVYLTRLPPGAGKVAIAKNNWRAGWRQRKQRGRVDYYVRVALPMSEMVDCSDSTRDLFLHKGPIILNRYKYDIFVVVSD